MNLQILLHTLTKNTTAEPAMKMTDSAVFRFFVNHSTIADMQISYYKSSV